MTSQEGETVELASEKDKKSLPQDLSAELQAFEYMIIEYNRCECP